MMIEKPKTKRFPTRHLFFAGEVRGTLVDKTDEKTFNSVMNTIRDEISLVIIDIEVAISSSVKDQYNDV